LALAAAGLGRPRGGGPHAVAGGEWLFVAAVVGISRTTGLVAVVCKAIGRRRGRIDRFARLAFARPAASTAAASTATAASRASLFVAFPCRLAVGIVGRANGLVEQLAATAVEPTIAVEPSFAVAEFLALVAWAAIERLAPFGCGQSLASLFATRLATRLTTISAAIPAATAAATAAAPTTTATRAVFTLAFALAPAIT
jgi:hypothetical protein